MIRDRKGTAAIEFALASPFFLALLIGLVDVGFGAYESMQVQNAAEAGALYAAKYGFSSAGISAAVANALGAGSGVSASPAPVEFCGCPSTSGVTSASCTSTCANGNSPGTYVQVDAALPYQAILSFPGLPIPATLTGQSVVRID